MSKIVTAPHPVLVNPAKPVDKINSQIRHILERMRQALIAADEPKGVGLAAPQIGVPLRIFMIRPAETDPIRTFINPVIRQKSKALLHGIPDSEGKLEGCLSVPHVWGIVIRHRNLTLEYTDEAGRIQTEKFSGFPAIIVQHEIDHLDGTLFTKRVLEQQGTLYHPRLDEKGEETLEPLDI